MANTTYKTTQDTINKLQCLKSKTKLKFYQDISNYSDEMNIRRQSGFSNLKKILLVKMFKVFEKFIRKYCCYGNFYRLNRKLKI